MTGDHANHEDWDIKVNAVEEIVVGERKGRHKPPPSVHPMYTRWRSGSDDKICCQHEPKMMMCSKTTYW